MEERYCAFLRGVNVQGTRMRMAEVCAVFEQTGQYNVSSVLASGNILFSSNQDKASIEKGLEKAMSAHFKYEAFLFVKTAKEVQQIYRQQPFTPASDFHIYGFIGVEGIEQILMEAFEKVAKVDGEEASIVQDNYYWKVPKSLTLESEFGKILGRKDMKNAFTSRNLNTFEKVLKKI